MFDAAEFWPVFSHSVQEFLGLSPAVLLRLTKSLLLVAAFFLLRYLFTYLAGRRLTDVQRRYIAGKTIGYVLGAFLLLALVRVWFGGTGSLGAYFGIVSAGLAIALQDPLTNLAGWFFITLRKPFVVGDRIQIGDHAGDVIDFRLFQFSLVEIGNWVQADQSTGRIIHIPNGWTFKQSIANYTQGFNFIWHEIPIVVTFESDWRRAKQIALDIARAHTVVKTDRAEQEIRRAARKFMIFFQHLTPIVWTRVADHGVVVTIRYLCEPRTRRSSEAAIWEEVLDAFAKQPGIDFAYPTTRFYTQGPAAAPPPDPGPPGT